MLATKKKNILSLSIVKRTWRGTTSDRTGQEEAVSGDSFCKLGCLTHLTGGVCVKSESPVSKSKVESDLSCVGTDLLYPKCGCDPTRCTSRRAVRTECCSTPSACLHAPWHCSAWTWTQRPTARVFGSDSPGKAAQWLARSIRKS
jgi:hypothetical protein